MTPRVVALGGGHGLAASLRALRTLTPRVTAVVTVADDGGSSGRLRREFGVLPPGDLRMALAALCDEATWGHTWARVVQHRFGGTGDLQGHSLGNLLIAALWEETGDIVAGLDWLGALLRIEGRVLPCATIPLDVVADVEFADRVEQIHGQVAVASTEGHVRSLRVLPENPPACPEAVAAIRDADCIVLGPGSWFTSVLTHLAIPDIRVALECSSAMKVLILNLESQTETLGFAPETHLEVLTQAAPKLRFDVVVADPSVIDGDSDRLRQACQHMGATLRIAPVASSTAGVHDPQALAAALADVLGPR